MKHAIRRTVAVLALAVLMTGVAAAPAAATAPTAAEAGARDRRVLWLGQAPALLVFRSDSSWECIASEPATLAFGLGYAAAKRSPDDVDRVWRRAEGSLEPAGDRAVRASNELARISRPDPRNVEQALSRWPKNSRRLVAALAAGLNLALAEEGRETPWTDVRVATLALQQDVFRPLTGDGAAATAVAGAGADADADTAPSGTVPPVVLTMRLGGRAEQAWGRRLAGWVEDLFPWLQVAQAEETAPGSSLFAWVDPSADPSPAGVLVWVDDSGSLGLVYRHQTLEARMGTLEGILDRMQPPSWD